MTDWILKAPKVLLHDHLDGGLRVQTILEVAEQTGYDRLPSRELPGLSAWFRAASGSADLLAYLARLEHTVSVMQTESALHRVAVENVLDLAEDGIRYAETRFAPELHLAAGLDPRAVVETIAAGIRDGIERAAAAGRLIDVRLIVCGMRQGPNVPSIARLLRDLDDPIVVGFDIAGPERGFPPSLFAEEFQMLREAGIRVTIHAGEADGVTSIESALACGAQRLGHGIRIIEDLTSSGWGDVGRRIRDEAITLETAPSSNLHTGAVATLRDHPALRLLDEGFAVTINTDNRLVSDTTLSQEFALLHRLGMSRDQFAEMTLHAARGSFLPATDRAELVKELEADLDEHGSHVGHGS